MYFISFMTTTLILKSNYICKKNIKIAALIYERSDQKNDKYYYYPIATRDIVLNPNLTQNPGW